MNLDGLTSTSILGLSGISTDGEVAEAAADLGCLVLQ